MFSSNSELCSLEVPRGGSLPSRLSWSQKPSAGLWDDVQAPSAQMNRALSVLQRCSQLLFGEGGAALKAEHRVPSSSGPQDPELRNSRALLGTACPFAANSLACVETIPF